MPPNSPSRNKAIVIEAFETLFNRRDIEGAKRFWSPDYIQHSALVPAGREGLFSTIQNAPGLRYEHRLAVAEGDCVMIHGRFSQFGQAANWIVVDICRLQDGVLVEHWDVIQDEVGQAGSAGGYPMFGEAFPPTASSTASQTDQAKAIVRAFYDGAARGRITEFADRLSDNFELFVPHSLPWGGRFDKAGYVALLPGVARALDFTRLDYLSLVGEGGHVVALIEIGVQGTARTIVISEHWDIADSKAVRLRVAYFDPGALLDQLARKPDA